MLRSCLVSHPETEELRLGYVRRLGLGMDVAIFGLELRVSDRFLSYDISHGSTVCGDPEPSESLPFTCDHLVLELWDKILSLLPTESRIDPKEQYRTKSLIAKSRQDAVESCPSFGSPTNRYVKANNQS
jgi:hypothetical protein